MYSMRAAGGGYQYPQGSTTTTTTYNIHYDNNRAAQNHSPTYNERRSTNPVQLSQPHPRPYTGSKTTVIHNSTPIRRVNPALRIDPNQPPRSSNPTFGKQNYTYKKNPRAEIDDSPIIDPSAFQYLNLNERKNKKPTSVHDMESGIDSRPIINFDAVAQLERRRQQQLAKNNRLRGDDSSIGGIDDRAIVDANAFRYIEAKTNRYEKKQGQGTESGIDDRPITNPDAFKYIDARRQPQPIHQSNEPSIDYSPIVNPDAFKYIENRHIPMSRNNDSGIDTTPIVNPDAFRYLENTGPPRRRDVQSGVDTTSIVNPDAFQYIERRGPIRSQPAESSIDSRPIVNPEAFKYIERKETRRRIDNEPEIDQRSYVNPQAFRYIERQNQKRIEIPVAKIDTRSFILDRNPNALAHLERRSPKKNFMESGIDERSYVNPDAFKYIEDSGSKSKNTSGGPLIDTRAYVDTDAFSHLEGLKNKTRYDDYPDRDGIDERAFVSPIAFRHLEFVDQTAYPYQANYSSYGHSDV